MIQVAQSGGSGGQHLAFAMSKSKFQAVFERIHLLGVARGDSFATVGNMQVPGREPASRGVSDTIYSCDPDRHLLAIWHYR